MTVIMKVDLVGPKSRGLAVGLNEFAGYLSVGVTAFLTGYLAERYGLRPEPFYLGIAIELRNPDASGQNLVRPPMGRVNSGQEMTNAGEVASRAITEAPASSKIPSQNYRGFKDDGPAWSPLVNQSGRRTRLNLVTAMTGEANSLGTLSCLSGRWNT